MHSLLETGNEVLIDTPATVSHNPLPRVDSQKAERLDDNQKANVRLVIVELGQLVRSIENEALTHGIDDGNVNDFVDNNFGRLLKKLREVFSYDKHLVNIDNLLFDNGYAVTNETSAGNSKHRVYVTQRHYFTC